MNSGFDMNKDLTAGRGADTILSAAFCQRHIPAALRYRGQLCRGGFPGIDALAAIGNSYEITLIYQVEGLSGIKKQS